MTDGGDPVGGLAEFAAAHGLAFSAGGELPHQAGLLSRDSLAVLATAAGSLPGGAEGTLTHLTYEYRSSDTTRTRELTTVVVEVGESIGFAPYLSDLAGGMHGGPAGVETRTIKLSSGARVQAAEGIDEAWLSELFSPALSDWLARSPDDFGWELTDGVLCASREKHLTGESDLVRLCEDASHLAGALREESLEEVDGGSAGRTAAKAKKTPVQVLVESLLPLVDFEQPPANVVSAQPAFRELVVRHPSTYFIGLFMGLAWALLINVVGGGIFGLLLNIPNPLVAVAIFELIVIGTTTFLSIRHQINSTSRACAAEAFWREYARSRDLELTDPLEFAATHAKVELPGKPQRVLTGLLDGVPGALMITGDGLKRGEKIALVAGPSGPVASADFEASAPGPSAKLLDDYAARLAAELRAVRKPG
jgi:hypothetical protein